MGNVYSNPGWWRQNASSVPPPPPPPTDMDLDQRVSKLETVIPTLATKLDLADLRAEMHKEFNAQTWRIVSYMLTICTALSGAVYFIARNVK